MVQQFFERKNWRPGFWREWSKVFCEGREARNAPDLFPETAPLFPPGAGRSGRGLFQTRPDILIRRAGTLIHVIDTKWKRIPCRIDDPKQSGIRALFAFSGTVWHRSVEFSGVAAA